jgi:hypothetical protein
MDRSIGHFQQLAKMKTFRFLLTLVSAYLMCGLGGAVTDYNYVRHRPHCHAEVASELMDVRQPYLRHRRGNRLPCGLHPQDHELQSPEYSRVHRLDVLCRVGQPARKQDARGPGGPLPPNLFAEIFGPRDGAPCIRCAPSSTLRAASGAGHVADGRFRSGSTTAALKARSPSPRKSSNPPCVDILHASRSRKLTHHLTLSHSGAPRVEVVTGNEGVPQWFCNYRQGALQVAQANGEAANTEPAPNPPAGDNAVEACRRLGTQLLTQVGVWLLCQSSCFKAPRPPLSFDNASAALAANASMED